MQAQGHYLGFSAKLYMLVVPDNFQDHEIFALLFNLDRNNSKQNPFFPVFILPQEGLI